MAAYTTIDDPEAYFQVKTYTGNGSTQSITFDGDTDLSPNMVWIKDRGATNHNTITDTVRTAVTYRLIVNATNAESNKTNGTTAFNSDGFSLGDHDDYNASSNTYVAWCWKESATAGFDIVSYTGNGSARTISHSLSAVPKFYVIKRRNIGDGWIVYHAGNTSAPETDHLRLDTTAATSDDDTKFNDTAPTSSVFSVGTDTSVNGNTDTYITYLFAPKQGYSAMGSYTGNGDDDGPFIYTGFRPAFIITKQTNNTPPDGQWYIYDNKRNEFNLTDKQLFSNLNNAESTGNNQYDFYSNGFKPRSSNGDTNASGAPYIYMAFAEAPFVNSNGVPCNAR